MTRPISLAALTVLELTPPAMVTRAAEAGFSHVGIRLLPATTTEPQYDIVGDTPLLHEIERRLADTGVKVLDVEISASSPRPASPTTKPRSPLPPDSARASCWWPATIPTKAG